MSKDRIVAILEQLDVLARLMQSGDISGDQAGGLLELAIAGARREIEGGE